MNFLEARLKYGTELGGMTRKDLSDNFMSHYNSKIKPMALETNMDAGEILNLFSSTPEKVNGRYRPQDATIDLLAYQGHRIIAEHGVPASPLCDFFAEDAIQNDENPSFELAVTYLQNIFRNIIDTGQGVDPRYSMSYRRVMEGSFSRSDLNRTLDPHATGMLETTRRYRPRLMISDVVGTNEPLRNRTIDIPIVEEVGQVEETGTGGRRLPRESMGVDEKTVTMSEEGRELEIQDTVRRSSTITIQAVAEHQMNRALRWENTVVNSIINMIAKDATAVAWPADPTSADLIELHMLPNDVYMITTIAGSLKAVVKYADIDPTTASTESKPGTGQRQFIDSILGQETIAKRDPVNVPQLGTDKERLIAWDRRNAFAYYTLRGGTISDIYRSEETRSFILRNIHTFGGRLKADADNCRWRITLG